MYAMEKNTAEKLAGTREVKTWKSRVNAIIHHAHSSLRFFEVTPK
jgi:hypothetical protein